MPDATSPFWNVVTAWVAAPVRSKKTGYRFDCGPTFFLYPRVLDEIFRSVGRDLMTDVPMRRLDPTVPIDVRRRGRMLDCTPDMDEMDRQIADFSPSDVGALRRYMDDNRVKLEKVSSDLWNSRFVRLPTTFARVFCPRRRHLHPQRSLGTELERYFDDPRLVIAFAFQSKYLGMSPFQCPSLFSILSFLEYEYGVWHPIGGCAAVSEKMAGDRDRDGGRHPIGYVRRLGRTRRSPRQNSDCQWTAV